MPNANANPPLAPATGAATSASAPDRAKPAAWVGDLAALPDRICAFFTTRPWLLLLPLVLLALAAAEYSSAKKPLWHDELFTFYLAQYPTADAMWAGVKSLDLNPPMLYFLTRASFAVLGVNTLATRLPEMVFYLLMLAGLFRFVTRRMGALFGGFAVALVLLGRSFDLAFEARPYALMLGCLALLLASWQEAVEQTGRKRILPVCLVLATSAGLMLAHIFALGPLVAVVGAELYRQCRQRRPDPVLLAALAAPIALVLVDLPILRGHGTAIYPAGFVPTLATISMFYVRSVDRELVGLLAASFGVLLLLGPRHLSRAASRAASCWFFSEAEWAAILLLALVPLAILLELMHTQGAFFPRYGIMCVPAVAAAGAALLCRWTSLADGIPDQRAGLIGLVLTLVLSAQTYRGLLGLADGQILRSAAHSNPVHVPCGVCAFTASAAAAHAPDGRPLPLVDASGLTFLEMVSREPAATADRVFYLTDREASTRIAHANIFERMAEVVFAFHLHGHAEPYRDFLATHRHFYVFALTGWQEDWLLPKLTEDGATLHLVLKTKDSYIATDLYEVTLPPSTPPAPSTSVSLHESPESRSLPFQPAHPVSSALY